MNHWLKILVIALGLIILVLFGILIFVRPAKGPTISLIPAVSSDGHLRVDAPHADDVIVSPFTVKGSVTGGGWFFEASFPVKILDGDGTVLGQGPAQAQGVPGAWIATGTVPFSASINFTAPRYATGTVVFRKDNPSGLPQNAGELSIPVRFK